MGKLHMVQNSNLTTLRQYMDNVPVESENPFYINYYKNGEWTNNNNRFSLVEAKGIWAFNEKAEDIDYFVIAVKAGFKVDIALESSAAGRWNGIENLPSGFDRETIGIGGNQFLRFTMTAGGFIEISGGITNDIAQDWSKLEDQLNDDATFKFLQTLPDYKRMRISADGNEYFYWDSIKEGNLSGNKVSIILDGVEKIPEDEEGGVPESQLDLVPSGEDSTTKEDIGTWETIHEEMGHKWEIVELNSPTDSKTWAFYLDGVLKSAWADKSDALIALNFNYDEVVKNLKESEPRTVNTLSGEEMIITSILGILFTRLLGGFL